MSLITLAATPSMHALPGRCAARAAIRPGVTRSTAIPPSTPGGPLWMCASSGVPEKFFRVRVTHTRCLPWFSRTLAVPDASPADGTSLAPFSVARRGRPAKDRWAAFDAFTHALKAFRFVPEACDGYCLPQALRDRFVFADVRVGLPASVASLIAAVAAFVQRFWYLRNAAVDVLPLQAARH